MGKVIVVLSGDVPTRQGYIVDHGQTPAVAANDKGFVVEVHESEKGDNTLWYWTGQRQASGEIAWRRHGRYGSGKNPAVAVNNAGWVVEVHKSEHHDRLWYQTGRLTSELDIQWFVNADYDDGILPTIRFDSLDGSTLREIHRSQAHNQDWDWRANVDGSGNITWSNNQRTNDPRWVTWVANDIEVGSTAENVLVYRTSLLPGANLIRYEQLAFIDLIESRRLV